MIARKEWFKAGVSGFMPNGWEGWGYAFLFLLLFFGVLNLPLPILYRSVLSALVLFAFLIDFLSVLSELYPTLNTEQKRQYWHADVYSFYTVLACLGAIFLYRNTIQRSFDGLVFALLLVMVIGKPILARVMGRR